MTMEPTLPNTAVVAIILFVAKEVFEFIRRLFADGRKRQAFRTMLARECELNLWTVKVLQRTIDELASDRETAHVKYSIERRSTGEEVFVSVSEAGKSSHWIPNAHKETMRDLMLDVATIDQRLFPNLQSGYDACINLQHVRDSLVTYVDEDQLDGGFLNSFVDYANSEISDILLQLTVLYFECTGQDLKNHRVR